MQTAACAVRASQCLTWRLAFGALLACLLAVSGEPTATEQVIDYTLRPGGVMWVMRVMWVMLVM